MDGPLGQSSGASASEAKSCAQELRSVVPMREPGAEGWECCCGPVCTCGRIASVRRRADVRRRRRSRSMNKLAATSLRRLGATPAWERRSRASCSSCSRAPRGSWLREEARGRATTRRTSFNRRSSAAESGRAPVGRRVGLGSTASAEHDRRPSCRAGYARGETSLLARRRASLHPRTPRSVQSGHAGRHPIGVRRDRSPDRHRGRSPWTSPRGCITVGNAKVRLHRARKALREELFRRCGTDSIRACQDCRCGEPTSGGSTLPARCGE